MVVLMAKQVGKDGKCPHCGSTVGFMMLGPWGMPKKHARKFMGHHRAGGFYCKACDGEVTLPGMGDEKLKRMLDGLND